MLLQHRPPPPPSWAGVHATPPRAQSAGLCCYAADTSLRLGPEHVWALEMADRHPPHRPHNSLLHQPLARQAWPWGCSAGLRPPVLWSSHSRSPDALVACGNGSTKHTTLRPLFFSNTRHSPRLIVDGPFLHGRNGWRDQLPSRTNPEHGCRAWAPES